MKLSRLARLAAALAASATLGAGAAGASAAPLAPASAAKIDQITADARFANAAWGIRAVDATTGELVYAQNPGLLLTPGSMTKLFSATAALESINPDSRFRTPVHRVGGTVENGVLDGNLVLVAQGDFSFGLREQPDGTLRFDDGGLDHNDANALQIVESVQGNPLRALNNLARDVRRSGIRRVRDVAIDARLFAEKTDWPDGIISPIWVNENVIDITVRPTRAGRRAAFTYQPRTPAIRVRSTVRTGRQTNLEVDEGPKGVVTISGTIQAGGPSTVRTFDVPDPPAFARSAFIQALRRAGVRVDARVTGPNPSRKLPSSRNYARSTRVGLWTSPPFSEYVKVVLKVSYNRGADLFACLVGVRAGVRDCEDGLGKVTEIARNRLGVPGTQYFLFDGAGSDDRNKITPVAYEALTSAATTRPWSEAFLAALPVAGVPGGGSLGPFAVGTPIAGKFRAKTGTRAGTPPGASAILLGARGITGYLQAASGRELLVTVAVNGVPFADIDDLFQVIEQQLGIVVAIYEGS